MRKANTSMGEGEGVPHSYVLGPTPFSCLMFTCWHCLPNTVSHSHLFYPRTFVLVHQDNPEGHSWHLDPFSSLLEMSPSSSKSSSV